MREVVTHIDRTDDERNDFLFTNNIRIADYMEEREDIIDEGNEELGPRKDGNYTVFIMTVINKIIEVVHDNSEDEKERTIYEKF